MRKLPLAVLAALAFGLIPSTGKADIPPPVPAPKQVKFTVEVDEKAKASKLVVPSSLVNPRFRPRPGLPKVDGKENLAILEYDVEDETVPHPANNRNHLMFAGVAFALALASGGVWLARRNRMNGRGPALMLVAGSTLAVGTLVYANAPPPAGPPPRKEVVLLPVAFNGNVTLEVVPAGDTIKLVLDKDTYESIKKDPKKPEGK